MADPINAINGSKVDYTKWKKMTAEEIIKEEGKGEEIPAEILTWAQQMAAFSKIPDNVTYEQVDGDVGLEALDALNLEDPANPTTDNAVAAVETETDDAVGDVVKTEETDDEIDIAAQPGNAAYAQPTDENPIDELSEENPEDDLSLADQDLLTDPEEIRKRKERKGLE